MKKFIDIKVLLLSMLICNSSLISITFLMSGKVWSERTLLSKLSGIERNKRLGAEQLAHFVAKCYGEAAASAHENEKFKRFLREQSDVINPELRRYGLEIVDSKIRSIA